MKRLTICAALLIAASAASPLYAAPTKGTAVPSIYNAPNMKDAQISAAEDWVLGVLGADRTRLDRVFSIFRGSGKNLDAKVSNFLFLRQKCWPASTWALSHGKVQNVRETGKGAEVSVICPDMEGRILEAEKKYKSASPEVARVLAEWRVAYDVASMKDRDMGRIEITRDAPVNAYGKLIFGENQARILLEAPEKTMVDTLKYIKAKKLKGSYIRRQINGLRSEIGSSSTISFSPELVEALNEVKL